MKLNKTEQKLLKRLEEHPHHIGGYSGKREANAAVSLTKKGLAQQKPCDGWYWHRHRNGDYSKRYHPQGYIMPVDTVD